jgi:hypothetical protein
MLDVAEQLSPTRQVLAGPSAVIEDKQIVWRTGGVSTVRLSKASDRLRA